MEPRSLPSLVRARESRDRRTGILLVPYADEVSAVAERVPTAGLGESELVRIELPRTACVRGHLPRLPSPVNPTAVADERISLLGGERAADETSDKKPRCRLGGAVARDHLLTAFRAGGRVGVRPGVRF